VPTVERVDVVVVGAGPAGSVTAYHLARAGARVMIMERASFPRDKPCGGGLTGRALRELPFGVGAVVEDVATKVTLRARYRGGYERRSHGPQPLVALTQRLRLDAFLAEQAARAGADLREGRRVTAVAEEEGGTVVTAGGTRVHAKAVVAADGANGIVARSLGLAQDIVHGVALEGNVRYGLAHRYAHAGRVTLEFGVVPGGYGWVFPKGDHVNVGVGGWEREGPHLREHLARLLEAHGLAPDSATHLRGHRLPMRRPGTRLSSRRAVAVGDAAGLVDPFSGDGIYEAFVSARLGAETVGDLLSGRAGDVSAYDSRLAAALGGLPAFSWRLKAAVDRYPRLVLSIVRLPPVWPVVEAVVRGDLRHPGLAGGPARLPVRALGLLARRAEARA
jgi:geranylgeranyl reductase family protein